MDLGTKKQINSTTHKETTSTPINFLQYVKPIREKTDLNELLTNYTPPDLSKVKGVIPSNEPLEHLLENRK